MRLAVISDIHGNLPALEKSFSFIDKASVDGVIWCGDYITDILLASEVLEFIRIKNKQYKHWMVRGNREDYILDYHNKVSDFSNVDVTGSLLCTYKSLSERDIKYISSMSDEVVVDIKGCPKIYVSHKLNNEGRYKYHIFGHVHKQCLMSKNGVNIINPGSLGLTWSGSPGLEFCILESIEGSWCPHFYHFSYNMEYVIKYIRNSDLGKCKYHWADILIRTLISGQDFVVSYIDIAKKVALQCGVDSSNLVNIPPRVWDYVYDNLDKLRDEASFL